MSDQEKAAAFAVPPIQAPPIADSITDRDLEHHGDVDSIEKQDTVTRRRTITVISSVTIVTAILGFLNGQVTVGIPVIAPDLHLDPSLILWCVFSLIWSFCAAVFLFAFSKSGLLSPDCILQAASHPIPHMRLHSAPHRVPGGHFWQPTSVSDRLLLTMPFLSGLWSFPHRHAIDCFPRFHRHIIIMLSSVCRQYHQPYVPTR